MLSTSCARSAGRNCEMSRSESKNPKTIYANLIGHLSLNPTYIVAKDRFCKNDLVQNVFRVEQWKSGFTQAHQRMEQSYLWIASWAFSITFLQDLPSMQRSARSAATTSGTAQPVDDERKARRLNAAALNSRLCRAPLRTRSSQQQRRASSASSASKFSLVRPTGYVAATSSVRRSPPAFPRTRKKSIFERKRCGRWSVELALPLRRAPHTMSVESTHDVEHEANVGAMLQ